MDTAALRKAASRDSERNGRLFLTKISLSSQKTVFWGGAEKIGSFPLSFDYNCSEKITLYK